MGEIPPQKSGAHIEALIQAMDSVGNRVMELPPTVTSWPPSRDEMFLGAIDGADIIEPYPNSMDIDRFYFGMDDRYGYILTMLLDKPDRVSEEIFAHAYGAAIVCPIDHYERQVNTEIISNPKALVYLPLLTMKGFFKFISLMGGKPDAKIDVKTSGKRLAMRVELKEFGSPEEIEKGFKIFSVTGIVNMRYGGDPEGVDITPMALIYPRSHKFTVK